MMLKNSSTSCSGQILSANCRLQFKKVIELINFNLQEPRTRECLELIRDNIDIAGDKIFKIKEIKKCMKFI